MAVRSVDEAKVEAVKRLEVLKVHDRTFILTGSRTWRNRHEDYKIQHVAGQQYVSGVIKESAVNYNVQDFTDPESIARMMNNVFMFDRRTEEFLYALCFTTKMRLVGVFEISHGSVDRTVASPREVFQKALLCGAAVVVLVHNHPSGNADSSNEDRRIAERMEEAGELIGIPVKDNIVIGKSGSYYSSMKERQRNELSELSGRN